MFALPTLLYSFDALEPYIGRKTFDLHYNVLHREYVNQVNILTPTEWEANDLLEVIEFADAGDLSPLKKNALQAWNHDFLWESMRAADGLVGVVDGPLAVLVKRDFGSMGALREAIVRAGTALFASGWVWLCIDSNQKLVIDALADEGNPLFSEDRKYPVLVADVWEHSYYQDYGPGRDHYLDAWFEMVANFDFATQNTRRVLQMMAYGKT